MKKLISLILMTALVLTACIGFASCEEKKTYTIGICQIQPHVALDAATQGFKDTLIAEFGEENVTFIEQNAQGDANACATIVNDFVTKNVDLILGNATPALQAAANGTETIPVLGTSVTEYGVALDIDNFSGTVGTNVSGTSDLAPLDQQAQMILDLFPEAKTVGMLYCSSEANSAYQVAEVKKYLGAKGITCVDFPFSDSNDVSVVSAAAAAGSDVIYIPTDNTAATCTEAINGAVLPTKTPIIAGEEGICSGCGVATLSISYYDLGVKTGEMAAEILLNGGDITKMPIQYDEDVVYKYNPEFCKKAGITVPEGYVALGEDAPAEEAASEPASETVSE
ncbi:MAG: ABC transporter substrate-binding protein [Clostridia bacterium]|nr:ABC transporter substrate-binding protein [Clostridia bacterium]